MNPRRAALLGVGAAAGAAALIAARARQIDRSPLATLAGGERLKVETSDGAVLEVHIAGSGPTVVLSHCWTGDMRIWEPVAVSLVDRGFRVVRYDHRGHGASTVGSGGNLVERLGTDLAELLIGLDARDAVVAGHSMGGMTAQAFAIDHPDVAAERVRALVLVATASRNTQLPGLRRAASFVLTSPAIEHALRSRFGHSLLRGVLGRAATPAAVRATRDSFVATAPEVRLSQGLSLLDLDLRESRARIAVPTTGVG
ncbi:MAG: alpha/beta fold hydrolase, partial [Acidimicrobiales bacterium]